MIIKNVNRGGGIGRHARFRFWCLERAGSIPAFGSTFSLKRSAHQRNLIWYFCATSTTLLHIPGCIRGTIGRKCINTGADASNQYCSAGLMTERFRRSTVNRMPVGVVGSNPSNLTYKVALHILHNGGDCTIKRVPLDKELSPFQKSKKCIRICPLDERLHGIKVTKYL